MKPYESSHRYVVSLKNDALKTVKRNAWPILYTLVAIVAGILIFLFLKKYHLAEMVRSKMMNPNREFIPVDASVDNYATLYLFYASWCPHSKKAMPEWTRFKKRFRSDAKRHNAVSFEEVDGDDEANTSVLKSFNIDAFPLVRMEANNKVYVFEGKITERNLNSFVEQFIPFPDSKNTTSLLGEEEEEEK